jgi:hypothetical protein
LFICHFRSKFKTDRIINILTIITLLNLKIRKKNKKIK